MNRLLPLLASVGVVALISGCAATGKSTAEATPGKFITYSCDGNKSFSVRFDAENGTARIRTHEGSAELIKGARDLYRDDGGEWILNLADGNKTELVYKSKAVYKNCSAK
jgi:hypothetical protein